MCPTISKNFRKKLQMIDAVSIFTKTGLVLWSLELIAIESDLIDSFIKSCLLEHRSSENKFSYRGYEFRWININRLNTFVLVVYKGILEARYLDTLLHSLKVKVVSRIPSEDAMKPLDLSGDFSKILDKCDHISMAPQANVSEKTPSPTGNKSGIGKGIQNNKSKEGRAWGISDKANAKTISSLDYSKPQSKSISPQVNQMYMEDSENESEGFADSDVDEKSSGLFGKLVSNIKNVTGNAQLTQTQLQPVLNSFMEGLMAKNVARDVAVKIVDSVGQTLQGTRTERFTSVAATVRETITKSIGEIMTPKKSIDVLKAAMDAQSRGEVYSICFLGVNGVGKSTNLAKVAYYLKNKGGLKILIAACDTFRSGAVEQLKTHATCLNVDLFERGYGKDSAEIAKQALQHARVNGYDVCLIDTAGRMQDNEPLMRAIAKLVAVNTPDLVLFVGEALVGHDAVDQLEKFNRALIDFSHTPSNPRTIDGIILTKYDTVDDKVGAALSMVFVTGQPVVFVGTGQKYPNLRKLATREIVKALVG